MSITDHTINAQFEYRISNMVRNLLKDIAPEGYVPETGDDLERWLDDNRADVHAYLLDDINTWMGFDELLKQVKGE